ncbi:MAG: sulfite exporter TauE/SafE family protein [Nannocystaceae bacterium]
MPTTSDLLFLAPIALVSVVVTYIGAAVGLVLGQFRLLLLVYWLGPVIGAAPRRSISSVGALFGALRHARERRVAGRLLLTIGLPSAAGAFVSASLAPRAEPLWIEVAIAVTLVISGTAMLVKARQRRAARAAAAAAQGGASAEESMLVRPPPGRLRLLLEGLVGLLLGAISGLVGLLLGTLRLPVLLRLAPEPAIAVGTNMAIGALTGLVAAVAAVREGSVDPVAFGVLAPLTMIAAHLGARETASLRRDTLVALIAWILILSGALMGVEVGLRVAGVKI